MSTNEEILLRSKLDLMTEAASMENFATHNSMDNMTEADVNFCLEAVETFDDDLDYPVEAIPVIVSESYGNQRYIVEYDMLYKLMETYDVDEVEAMNMLCEVNNINMDDLYLMIESQEYFEEKMQEAGSKGGSNLKSTKSQNLIKSVNDLKAKGIKVVKKGNKKGKKKKRRNSFEFQSEKVKVKADKNGVKAKGKSKRIKL